MHFHPEALNIAQNRNKNVFALEWTFYNPPILSYPGFQNPNRHTGSETEKNNEWK